MPRRIRRITAQGIQVSCMRVEYFLTQQVYSERNKNIRRKLLLRRLGVILGEAIRCIVCRDNEVAFREHIARCAISGLGLTKALGASGTNPLDDILN